MKMIVSLSIVLVTVAISLGMVTQKERSTSIHGRISDLWGDPLEEAKILFYKLTFERGAIVSAEGKLEQSIVTDEQGNYRISGLPPGVYRIAVELRGFRYTEVWRFQLIGGEDHLLDFGLEVSAITEVAPMEVAGTIKQNGGLPVQDAMVTVMSAFNNQILEQARTLKDGRYRIRLRTPGQYIVYAAKPGFSVNTRAFLSERETNVDITLEPLVKR